MHSGLFETTARHSHRCKCYENIRTVCKYTNTNTYTYANVNTNTNANTNTNTNTFTGHSRQMHRCHSNGLPNLSLLTLGFGQKSHCAQILSRKFCRKLSLKQKCPGYEDTRKQSFIVVILTSLLLLKAKWSTFLGTTTQVAAKSDMQVWTHAHSYLSSLMVVMMMMMVDDVK